MTQPESEQNRDIKVPSLLDQIVEKGVERFWGTRSYEYEGKAFGYTELHAAGDALTDTLSKTGLMLEEATHQLTHTTSIQPRDLVYEVEMDHDSWSKLLRDILEKLVAQEITSRFPEIYEEVNHRLDEFDFT